jgi:hypothetical protein
MDPAAAAAKRHRDESDDGLLMKRSSIVSLQVL